MAKANKNLNLNEIRDIFLKPNVTYEYELKWPGPNIDGVVNFLCGQRGFSETRVRGTLEKAKKIAEEKEKQSTLDSFFGKKN
jgi:flap endonuclease-1